MLLATATEAAPQTPGTSKPTRGRSDTIVTYVDVDVCSQYGIQMEMYSSNVGGFQNSKKK